MNAYKIGGVEEMKVYNGEFRYLKNNYQRKKGYGRFQLSGLKVKVFRLVVIIVNEY